MLHLILKFYIHSSHHRPPHFALYVPSSSSPYPSSDLVLAGSMHHTSNLLAHRSCLPLGRIGEITCVQFTATYTVHGMCKKGITDVSGADTRSRIMREATIWSVPECAIFQYMGRNFQYVLETLAVWGHLQYFLHGRRRD